MARKGFLWFIFSPNKRPLYLNDAGQVMEGNENYLKPDGQPAHLQLSPIGWKDTLVKYGRNTTYWGLLRDLTAPMTFPGDGFEILKAARWAEGYEAIRFLGILKLDRYALPYNYKDWYFTELNFTKYRQGKTSVTVEALEGGMSKLIKAFESTEFEIDIDDDPEAVTVLADGVPLQMLQEYSWLQDFHWGGNEVFVNNFTIPMVKKNPDGLAPYVALQDQFADVADSANGFYEYLVNTDNWFLRVTEDGPDAGVDVHINGRIDVTQLQKNVNQGPITFRVWHVYKDDTRFTLASRGPGTPDIFKGYILGTAPKYERFSDGELQDEITFDFIVSAVKPGDRLILTTEYLPFTQTLESLYTFDETSFMDVQYQTRLASTYVKGLYPHRVLEKLVDKIKEGATLLPTDDNTYFKSDWLKFKKDLVLMSGDSIRGLEGSKLKKVSLRSFFRSMDFYGASLGVKDGRLFIELIKDVFGSDIIADLGEVSDATLETAEDLLISTIRTGGPTIDYNDVNGRYEFNQGQQWRSVAARPTAELDLTTPFRRDCYGFEFTRRNLDGKKTTDGDGDNDTWMVNIETTSNVAADGTVYYKLNRPPYVDFEGAPADVFNTELTPKQGLLNNGPKLRSFFEGLDSTQLTLASADKNTDLVTQLTTRLAQKEPIPVANLGARLFLPVYINFTTKVSMNLLPVLDANPYGKVRFTVNGRPWYGYLMDGGVKPAMNDTQVWKLLAAPENDFSKFYKPL